MLHHDRHFTDSVVAERRAAAARRRVPADPGELERVVTAAAQGSGGAWSALVERFSARLRRVVRTYRLPAHDAEDVLQTTWLLLLEHIDNVREPRAVGTWLETTARRESLRALTAQRRERPTDEELLAHESAEPVDEARLVAADRRSALRSALQDLSPRQQQLVAMLLSESEPSYAEISRALRMPIGSIGPTRERSLARLRANGDLVSAVGRHA
jgi:RNA polymerase sigma factor (sigma-70 family)